MLAVILIPGYIQLQRLALYRNGRGRQLGVLGGITVILICRDDIGSRLLRSESAVSDSRFRTLALTGLPPGVGDISLNLCFVACGNIVSVFRYSLLLHGQINRRTVYARNLVFFANSALVAAIVSVDTLTSTTPVISLSSDTRMGAVTSIKRLSLS